MKKIFKEEEMKYEKNKVFPILRDFKEENLRSSVTDFELIFPIKENIQYYAQIFCL